MAFDPFEKIDKEENEFYGIDPNTGAIEDKEYYYNPITGRSDADAPLSREENFKNAGFLDNILSGIKAGASGVLSGQATLSDTFLGMGGDMANDLNEIAKRNTRTHNWNFDTITSNPMAYITDPQGLAYDAGNMTGSALMMGAETAALGTMAGAAGVGNLSTLANYFAGKAAAHGLPSLAKALSSKYGSLIVANVAKTPIEVSSESGNVIQDMKEEGITDPDQLRKAAAVNALIQTPLLTLSNSVESLGLGTMFGKNISSKAGKAALGATGVIGGALQQSWEEGMQRGASDYAKGEQPGGLTSVVDPFEWTQGQKDEAAAAFGPGMLFGGAGALGSRIARKWADRDTIEANAREFNPNDPNDNGPLPELGGPDNNNNGPSGNGSDAEMKDETIDTTATEGPEETVSSENEEAAAPASSGEDISSLTDDLASAITGQESGGDTSAVNKSSGAYGSMQIMPENWDAWSKEALGHVGDIDNQDDYNAVVKYKIEQYMKDYGVEGAVVAWYAGPENGERWSEGKRTGIDADGNEYSFDAPQSDGPSVSDYVAQVMGRVRDGGGDVSTGGAVSSYNPGDLLKNEGNTWNRSDNTVDVEDTQDVLKSGLSDVAAVYKDMFGIPLTVTSGNDSDVHADGPRSHGAGVKVDVSGGVLDDADKRHAFIQECEKRGIRVIDEYENPSPNSTGGHLDLDFTNYNGGGGSSRSSAGDSGLPSMKEMQDYLKENELQFDPDLNNAIEDALKSNDEATVKDVFDTVKDRNEQADAETKQILDELKAEQNPQAQQAQADEGNITNSMNVEKPQTNTSTTTTTEVKGKPTAVKTEQPAIATPKIKVAPTPNLVKAKHYSDGMINMARKAQEGDKEAADLFGKIRKQDQEALKQILAAQDREKAQQAKNGGEKQNVVDEKNQELPQEHPEATENQNADAQPQQAENPKGDNGQRSESQVEAPGLHQEVGSEVQADQNGQVGNPVERDIKSVKASYFDKPKGVKGKVGYAKGGLKDGYIDVWTSYVPKNELKFRLPISDIEKAVAEGGGNSSATLDKIAREKIEEAGKKWIDKARTPEEKKEREGIWYHNDDAPEDTGRHDRIKDSVQRVIRQLYKEATGHELESKFEKFTREKKEAKAKNQKAQREKQPEAKEPEAKEGKAASEPKKEENKEAPKEQPKEQPKKSESPAYKKAHDNLEELEVEVVTANKTDDIPTVAQIQKAVEDISNDPNADKDELNKLGKKVTEIIEERADTIARMEHKKRFQNETEAEKENHFTRMNNRFVSDAFLKGDELEVEARCLAHRDDFAPVDTVSRKFTINLRNVYDNLPAVLKEEAGKPKAHSKEMTDAIVSQVYGPFHEAFNDLYPEVSKERVFEVAPDLDIALQNSCELTMDGLTEWIVSGGVQGAPNKGKEPTPFEESRAKLQKLKEQADNAHDLSEMPHDDEVRKAAGIYLNTKDDNDTKKSLVKRLVDRIRDDEARLRAMAKDKEAHAGKKKKVAPIEEWKDPNKNPFLNGQIFNHKKLDSMSKKEENKLSQAIANVPGRTDEKGNDKPISTIPGKLINEFDPKAQQEITSIEQAKALADEAFNTAQKARKHGMEHGFIKGILDAWLQSIERNFEDFANRNNVHDDPYLSTENYIEGTLDAFTKNTKDPREITKVQIANNESNNNDNPNEFFKNHIIVTGIPDGLKPAKNATMKEKEGEKNELSTNGSSGNGSGKLADGHRGVQPETVQKTDEGRQAGSNQQAGSDNGRSARPGSGESGSNADGRTDDNGLQQERPAGERSEDGSGGDEVSRPQTAAPGDVKEEQPYTKPEAVPAGNDYHLTKSINYEGVGKKTLFKRNLDAINLVNTLEMENRLATPAEQKVLAGYSGWGSMAEVFTENADWKKEQAALKEALTDDEYESARASVNDAFYTPDGIVKAIWKGVEHMGFKGGKVLDPSMGTGIFFATMPKDMYAHSNLLGVEKEKISSSISKQLYQSAHVDNNGYEDEKLPPNFYDLVISNVPFSSVVLNDPVYNKDEFPIHNYFFNKSINMVRPGGLVVFITSTSTLDGSTTSNELLRKRLAEKTDLVAAFRLPNNTFKSSSKTQVTSDLIILQRRYNPAEPAKYAQPFLDTTWKPFKNQYGVLQSADYNEYFLHHPENVLGRPTNKTQFGYGDGLMADGTGLDPVKLLTEALKKLPKDIYKKIVKPVSSITIKQPNVPKESFADGTAREYSIIEKDGKLFQKINGKFVEMDFKKANQKNESDASRAKADTVRDYIKFRDTVNDLLEYQMDENATDEELAKKRKKLNEQYDEFVKQHGPINDPENVKLYATDPDAGKVTAVESYDFKDGKPVVKKAAVFTKRTTGPVPTATNASTPDNALAISVAQKGRVDLPFMAKLLGEDNPENVAKKLKGELYFDPAQESYVLAEEYLSGNVRKKLAEAKAMAKADKQYQANVDALEKVQPLDMNENDIEVKMGMNWIPVPVYQQFANEMFGPGAVDISYSPMTGKWIVARTGYGSSADKWATRKKSAADIMQNAMSMKAFDIKYTDDNGKTIQDTEATEAANAKVEELEEAFRNWIWSNNARKEKLLTIFNNKFNNLVLRKYDGSRLNPQLGNTKAPEAERFKLRPYQQNVVWRIMQRKNVLINHCVGAGKTAEMQVSGMEMKRLGIINKPMYVVPTATIGQFAEDFQKLYPKGNFLVLKAEDIPSANIDNDFDEKLVDADDPFKYEAARLDKLEKEKKKKKESKEQKTARLAKRRRTLSRIQTEDWDAIIITHEMFKRLPMSPESYNKFYKEQLAELEATLTDAKRTSGKKSGNRFTKQLEKQKANLEQKLKRDIAADKKEIITPFEELGVDQLYVDEADCFKNLVTYTTHGDLKGISTTASARSTDMYAKCRWMNERYHGGIVFATGTPISNSMNELYTMQRYLDYDGLKAMGIHTFDSWLSQFGETKTDFEPADNGKGFKKVEVATFDNLPVLFKEVNKFTDVIQQKDLPFELPKVEYENVEVDTTPFFKKNVWPWMLERLKNLKGRMAQKGADNKLVWLNDFRQMTTDLRLFDPKISKEDAGLKVPALADNVYKVWRDTTKATENTVANGTQMIFCDLINSKKRKKGEEEEEANDEFAAESQEAMNLYKEIKDELISRGIPAKEIAFITDAKDAKEKKDLLDKVDKGEIRVIIGSTTKLGVGVNCQSHVVALHMFTLPNRPRDEEQRLGRGERQGNLNKVLKVFHYLAKGTFDAFNLSMLERKAKTINALWAGDQADNDMEDIDDQSALYAKMEEIATGDPEALEFKKTENLVRKLRTRKKAFEEEKIDAKQKIRKAEAAIERAKEFIPKFEQDIKNRKDINGDNFTIKLGDKTFTDKKKAQLYLNSLAKKDFKGKEEIIGNIAGFNIIANTFDNDTLVSTNGVIVQYSKYGQAMWLEGETRYAVNTYSSLKSLIFTANSGPDRSLELLKENLKNNEITIRTNNEVLAKPFRQEKELATAEKKYEAMKKAIINKEKNGGKSGVVSADGQQAMTQAHLKDVLGDDYDENYGKSMEELLPEEGTSFNDKKYSLSGLPDVTRSLDALKQEVRDAFPKSEITDSGNEMQVKTNAGTITVDLKNNIILGEKAEAKARKAHGMQDAKNVTTEGYYQPKLDGESVIALSKASAEGAAYHEAFHAAWDMALTPKEKAAMRKYFSRHNNGKTVDEAMADGYREWKLARNKNKGTAFGKLFQKVTDFANKAKAILTGSENVHNVMRNVAEGDVWNRTAEIADAALKAMDTSNTTPISRQEYTSAGTSLNQVPAMFKTIPWQKGATNIDIGGGRFNTATDYLDKEHGVKNIVFGPFNRTKAENEKAMEAIKGKAQTVTVANVLNVISEPHWRQNVILQAAKALKPDGTAYFQIYEGNKSGVGNTTQKGKSYQNNLKTSAYIPEVARYFKDVERKGNVLIAKQPTFDPNEKAFWSMDDLATDDIQFSIRDAGEKFAQKVRNGGNGNGSDGNGGDGGSGNVKPHIEVREPKVKRDMDLTQYFVRSPSYIAEDIPKFRPFFQLATKAQEKQENLRNNYNKRLNRIRERYLHGSQDIEEWTNLLWMGDAEQKEYSQDELKEMGVPENVGLAYSATRSMIGAIYKQLNEVRTQVEKHSRRVKREELRSIMDDPFNEITRVEDMGLSKTKDDDGRHHRMYLVTYKRPKTYRTTDEEVSPELYRRLRDDENIQITKVKRHGKNYVVDYEEKRGDIHKLTGYIPHFFHNFFIVAKDDDGNNMVVGSGINVKDAYKKAEEYAKKNPDKADNIVIAPKQFSMGDGSQITAAEISDGQYFKMVSQCEDQLKMNLHEAREFLSDKVRMKGRHRFFGNFLQRKGVQGYEENMDWVLHHYTNAAARYIALEGFKPRAISLFERYFGNFSNDWRDDTLAKYTKQYILDMNGTPHWLEQNLNQALSNCPTVANWLKNKFGDRPAIMLINSIMGYISVAKLGLNPSSALLNLIQILNAYGLTGDEGVTMKAMHSALKPTLRDIRVLHDCGVYEDVNISSGNGYTGFRPRSILDATMKPFEFADRYSRKVAALSAYYHAMKEGMSYKEAIEYAKDVNRKANFDYSPADAPGIFRAASGTLFGDTALQFQKYKFKQAEVMHEIIKKSGLSTNIKHWALYFLLAGLLQVPLSDWFNDLFNAMFGVDYKLKAKAAIMEMMGGSKVGRALARVAMYGLLSITPLNVDISRRIGAGDFMASPKDTLLDVLGGPFISTITQMVAGIRNANPIQVLGGLSPALKNIAQAVIGERKDSKGRNIRSLDSIWSRIQMAIGFRNADEAVQSDVSQIRTMKQKEMQEDRESFIKYILNKQKNGEARTPDDIKKMKEYKLTNKKLKAYEKTRDSDYKERLDKSSTKRFKNENDNVMNFLQPVY